MIKNFKSLVRELHWVINSRLTKSTDDLISFLELIAWETQVKKENPDFNLDELSKRERARQMVIHELINVHHNACIKINFLINIFKPTIIRESKLKEAQLGVSSFVLTLVRLLFQITCVA